PGRASTARSGIQPGIQGPRAGRRGTSRDAAGGRLRSARETRTARRHLSLPALPLRIGLGALKVITPGRADWRVRRPVHNLGSMLIETRILGRKRRPLDGWTVPTPPGTGDEQDGDGLTLRELIGRVVRQEVRAFERRAEARRLLRVLSESEITEAAARG